MKHDEVLRFEALYPHDNEHAESLLTRQIQAYEDSRPQGALPYLDIVCCHNAESEIEYNDGRDGARRGAVMLKAVRLPATARAPEVADYFGFSFQRGRDRKSWAFTHNGELVSYLPNYPARYERIHYLEYQSFDWSPHPSRGGSKKIVVVNKLPVYQDFYDDLSYLKPEDIAYRLSVLGYPSWTNAAGNAIICPNSPVSGIWGIPNEEIRKVDVPFDPGHYQRLLLQHGFSATFDGKKIVGV